MEYRCGIVLCCEKSKRLSHQARDINWRSKQTKKKIVREFYEIYTQQRDSVLTIFRIFSARNYVETLLLNYFFLLSPSEILRVFCVCSLWSHQIHRSNQVRFKIINYIRVQKKSIERPFALILQRNDENR